MTAATIGLAAVLDAAIGEPPTRIHPVAWFGRLIAPLDRSWSRPRLVGVLATATLPLGAALVVGAFVAVAGLQRPLAGAVAGGIALFVATSLRRLLGAARTVTAASEADLDAAREQLWALAGRDASVLSAGEVRSAAVESVAENLADGLVAPLGSFAVLAVAGSQLAPAVAPGVEPAAAGLALGAAGAAWVKAVNTMDSMLGYRSKPVGWAPARLDDAVMWVPARASAVLIAAAFLAPGSLASARRWNGGVPSPNSGWPMGTIAAALGVRLEKPGVYELPGGPALPTVNDAERAVRRAGVAGGLAYLAAGGITWV